MMDSNPDNKIFLSFDDVKEKIGMSRTSIDRWEQAGIFPKRVHLGVKKIAWHKDEIDKWINDKMASKK